MPRAKILIDTPTKEFNDSLTVIQTAGVIQLVYILHYVPSTYTIFACRQPLL